MRLSFIIFVACLFTLLACCVGQKLQQGSCPAVSLQKDFSLNKFLGEWYEVERNPVAAEEGTKCNMANFMRGQGGRLEILLKGIKYGDHFELKGNGTVNNNEPANISMIFEGDQLPIPYLVLDAEYATHAVTYSCVSVFGMFYIEYIWILSRQPVLGNHLLAKAYEVLANNGISRELLEKTDQSCFQ